MDFCGGLTCSGRASYSASASCSLVGDCLHRSTLSCRCWWYGGCAPTPVTALAPLLEPCSTSWHEPGVVFGSAAACGAAEAGEVCAAPLLLPLSAGTGEHHSLLHDRRQGTWPTPGTIRDEILPPRAHGLATRSTCAAEAPPRASALLNPPPRSETAVCCVGHGVLD